ncbi:unnamed protein product, partial [Brugia timori]|uniref:DUF772 domain-containing protein n=1 Tax=Brugia timori TaxID=42155 RepID=A0A0R3R3D5_9BILA
MHRTPWESWGMSRVLRLCIGHLAAYRMLDDGSRLSREAHVRFCEGLGVRFPRPTHPLRPDVARLAVPGGGAGPLRPQGRGMVHEADAGQGA